MQNFTVWRAYMQNFTTFKELEFHYDGELPCIHVATGDFPLIMKSSHGAKYITK